MRTFKLLVGAIFTLVSLMSSQAWAAEPRAARLPGRHRARPGDR